MNRRSALKALVGAPIAIAAIQPVPSSGMVFLTGQLESIFTVHESLLRGEAVAAMYQAGLIGKSSALRELRAV